MKNNEQYKRTIIIGTLRNIEILSVEESNTIDRESLSTYNSNYSSLFPDNSAELIGFVLYGYPILYSPKHNSKIYSVLDNAPDNNITCIADNISALNEILNLIEDVWKGKEGDTHLVKNDQNLSIRKEVLEKIATLSPDADLSFWDWIAFEELTITLR